jgi:hypothetical protein
MKKEAPQNTRGSIKRPPMRKEAPQNVRNSIKKTSDENRDTLEYKGLD